MLAWIVARVYACLAPWLMRRLPPCRRVRDEVVALVGAQPRRVLDATLGAGDLALALADAGHLVVGIESNDVLCRIARRRLATRRTIQVADGSVPRAMFDVVVSLHALYAEPAWEQRLRLARRALRPGGYAILVNFAAPFPLCATLRATARRDGVRAAAVALVWLAANALFERLRRPRTASYWPEPLFQARVREAGFEITDLRRTFLNDGSVVIVARAPSSLPTRAEAAVAVSELTRRVARPMCALAADALGAGARLSIRVDDVRAADVIGLAALVQIVRRAGSARVCVSGGVAFRRLVIDAHLADVLPTGGAGGGPVASVTGALAEPAYIAQGRLVALRLADAGDVPRFEEWASDRALDHLVGSDLLYVCRHRRDEPDAIARAILGDPTALTVVVEPRDDPGRAIGYVRLYHVRLGDGFAFLETAMAEREYHRAGCGVEATRLLLAYGVDALELNRIEAKVYAYNTASRNALRRRGFREEGRLHEAHAIGDRRADVLVFAMFGDEMRRRRQRDPLPYMGLWTA